MDWQELTNLTRGRPFVVERVRLAGSGVAIEGEFELPQLAQLDVEDQLSSSRRSCGATVPSRRWSGSSG